MSWDKLICPFCKQGGLEGITITDDGTEVVEWLGEEGRARVRQQIVEVRHRDGRACGGPLNEASVLAFVVQS